MRTPKLVASIALALSLTGCVGAVVGVAVDTTVAVVKAPFQVAGAVVGVAADTTGTVIAAPFRMAGAAVGGGRHEHHHRHHDEYDEQGEQHREHEHAAEHFDEGSVH